MLKKLWDWLCGKTRQLWTIVVRGATSELLEILNDAELQQAALEAVKSAAANGLNGNDAFAEASALLRQKISARGETLRDHLVDTLVQNAYAYLKNSIED